MIHPNSIRLWIGLSLATFLTIQCCSFPVTAQDKAAPDSEAAAALKKSFTKNVQPLLAKYCYRCHNADEMESGIRVDHLDGSIKERRLMLWNAIQKNITEQTMPPEDEAQPTDKELKILADWIKSAADFARSRPQPKNGSSRRLTVVQYQNTLQELLGVRENVAASLPPDAVSKDGFVNNEQSMLMSPLLIEAYLDAAEKALDLSLVDENTKPVIQNFRVDLGRGINPKPFPDGLILGANSRLLANPDFQVHELVANKPFEFEPFRMQRKFRFIEGYRGNSTVRGWKEFDSIYHAVFACVRGNSGYPKGLAYETVPEGLLLRPAIPSAELFGVSSTYGPQANFKIALRELPDHGNFLIKVKAAKYVGGLLLDRNSTAVDKNTTPDVSVIDPTEEVQVDIPDEGIYQAIVHLARPGDTKVEPDAKRLKEKLIGHWDFDKGFDDAQKIEDLTGKALGNLKTVESPFGQALELDGKDDSVVIKRNNRMNVGDGEFTVAAWIRPKQLRQAGIICLGKYSWTHGWYFDMPNGRGVLRIETASPENQPNGTVQSKPGVIRANQWQHVAAVVRPGTDLTVLYVNGYEVARGKINKKNLDNPKVDLYIGRIQDSHHFKGNIDRVRFYSRALEPAEIQALLAGGEKFVRPPPTDKPKIVHLGFTEQGFTPKEISGTLWQPEFALMRFKKGQLKLKAIYDGSEKVSRVDLIRVEENSEWGKRFQAFEKRNPNLGAYLGLRRDCGHTLAPVGEPVVVDSDRVKEYRFIGAINNFPNPRVEKDNVNYLAGVREIGVRSEFTDGRDMPRLLVHSVEFEGPYFEAWPPRSHRAILKESGNRDDIQVYAREVLKRFATKAYRRPATVQEIDSLMQTFNDSYRQSQDFQASIKDALLVVLVSPQFLFLVEESRSPAAELVDDYELASKLSYFLWNSPPDSNILDLAGKRELRESLEGEVKRMIADRKFERFSDSFARQWLNLDKLDVVNIDRKKFPRLTRIAKKELGREPVELLRFLVQNNLPVRDLIAADYIVANEVTSKYYELQKDAESGFRFSKVSAQGRPELGGLLSNAGILAGLSDGRESNPIKRGAWLARKIIAEPPSDPPPNVLELGEDTSHLPLRERLAIHRNQKGCVKCHTGIDPWGLPLEQFDAGGRFQPKSNPNAQSKLPDQTEINGFLALKEYLSEDRIDQVVFSFVKHLTIYAIGRSLTYNELESLKQKCFEMKARDLNMQEIFLLVVQSKMFLEK